MWLKKRVKLLLENDFNRNFLILFSASGVAQLIPILSSLILVRFYSPQDFGVLALFNGILGILTPLSSLRYEFAIPLPRKPRESIVLVLSSSLIAFAFSIILLFVFLLFKPTILTLFKASQLGNWIYLIPITVFLGGIYNVLNYFNVKYKKFGIISQSNIIRSFVSSFIQIFLGIFKLGHPGLILGNVISLLAGNSKMILFLKRFVKKTSIIKRKEVYSSLKKYKDFPLISIWGVLLNNISLNINNFFISGSFGLTSLGYYSYSYKNLSLPLSIISNNIGQVFYQKCLENKNNFRSSKGVFVSTVKKLVLITGPIFVLLFFFIEDLFSFFFGEDWRVAGTYGKILLPLFFVRSIFSPLSMITMALEKQRLMLFLQIFILGTNVFAFGITYFLDLEMRGFLYTYCLSSTFIYSVSLLILYNLSKKNLKND